MNDDEKMAYIESIFPYKEQSTMIFAYNAFIELLKYQKEKINNKVVWECYIKSLKEMMSKDLKELLNERN